MPINPPIDLPVITITGSAADDTLDAPTAKNTYVLYGLDGNDKITGNNHHDSLIGGNGNDTLYMDNYSLEDSFYGDAGIDSFDMSKLTGVVNTASTIDTKTDLSLKSAQKFKDDGSGGTYTTSHYLVDIENVNGSSFRDSITGNSLNNLINGNNGNDLLNGLTGHDTLLGGNGNDTIYAGQDGFDSLDGGLGRDLLSFEKATAGIDINLNYLIAQPGAGGAYGSYLRNFENVNGSAYADHIEDGSSGMNANNNIIKGMAGNDYIMSWTGNDTVFGGTGNDTIRHADGNDTLSSSVLNGDSGNDLIYPGHGNNTVNGGTGNDTIFFTHNFGHSTVTGGAGADIFEFYLGTYLGGNPLQQNATLTDFNVAEDIIYFEQASGWHSFYDNGTLHLKLYDVFSAAPNMAFDITLQGLNMEDAALINIVYV